MPLYLIVYFNQHFSSNWYSQRSRVSVNWRWPAGCLRDGSNALPLGIRAYDPRRKVCVSTNVSIQKVSSIIDLKFYSQVRFRVAYRVAWTPFCEFFNCSGEQKGSRCIGCSISRECKHFEMNFHMSFKVIEHFSGIRSHQSSFEESTRQCRAG